MLPASQCYQFEHRRNMTCQSTWIFQVQQQQAHTQHHLAMHHMQVTRAHKALTTNGLRGTLKQKHTQVVLDDSALLGSSCSLGIAQAILGYISCLGSPQVSWGHTPLTHLGTTPSSFSLSHLALNPSNSLGTVITSYSIHYTKLYEPVRNVRNTSVTFP